MPRYPLVISFALSQQLYDQILKEVEEKESRVSVVVRNALEEHYGIQMLTIIASEKEVAQLRGLGYRIAEQE